jgi:hypothetical protein
MTPVADVPIPNLPRLNTYGRFDPPTEVGSWCQVSDLLSLAESLDIGTEQVSADDIKSIPDAWAQLLIFKEALFHQHLMHDDVVRQWRGLLALIALQPEHDTLYALRTAKIKIADDAPEGASDVFRRALRQLRSDGVRELNSVPDELNVLYVQDLTEPGAAWKVAGVLAPQVLVAAAKTRDGLSIAHVPWLRHGLDDPSNADGLSPRHYQILAKYADGQRESVSGKGEYADALRRELDRFAQACHARGSRDRELDEVDVDLDLRGTPVSALVRTYRSSASTDSDFLLHLRPELQDSSGPLKGLILIDRADKAVGDKIVWSRFTMADAANPATFASIKRDAAASGYIVLEKDELFSPVLASFERATIPGNTARGFASHLLPFSPLVLLLMAPEELVNAASLSKVGGEWRARLELVMRDSRGGRAVVGIAKDYGAADLVEFDAPKDLAVWPNFRRRGWEWTFLRFQYIPDYDLNIRGPISGEIIKEDLNASSLSVAEAEVRLRQWAAISTGPVDERIWPGRLSSFPNTERALNIRLRFAESFGGLGEGNVGEIHRLPKGLEAIAFAMPAEDDAAAKVAAGLLPINLALEEKPAPRSATVAIDFGTSNTIAYRQLDGGGADPVKFSSRVVFPVRSANHEARTLPDARIAFTTFFPIDERELPFPTAARRTDYSGTFSTEIRGELEKGSDEHGHSDVAFFKPADVERTTLERIVDETLTLLKKRALIFDLKWGDTDASQRVARRFIRQIMFMSAAELVPEGVDPQSITWRFSYPQAFTDDQLSMLLQEVRSNAQEMAGDYTGQKDLDKHVLTYSESAAAAQYFAKREGAVGEAIGRLVLMLDIGGGTTDAALWYDRKMLWRQSFKVAAGNFFTSYIANNPSFMKELGLEHVAAKLGSSNQAHSRHFTELYVNTPQFTKVLAKMLPSARLKPDGAGLRYAAFTAVGGVMYYIGLVLQRLVRDGLLSVSALSEFSVAFGGRGSEFFRHFAYPNGGQLKKLVGMGLKVAGVKPEDADIGVVFSHMAKHEVAYGMLLSDETSSSTPSYRAPLGADIRVRTRDGETTIPAWEDAGEVLKADGEWELDLATLEEFLSSLGDSTGIGIDLTKTAQSEIRKSVTAELGERMRQVRAARETATRRSEAALQNALGMQLVEPPFISALRKLVDILARPRAERDRHLKVVGR